MRERNSWPFLAIFDHTRLLRRSYRRALLGLLLLPLASSLGAQKAADVLGVWVTPETKNGYVHVDIRREEGLFAGTIIWLSSPTYPAGDSRGMGGQLRVDRDNPDPALRQRPILGLRLMEGFQFDGAAGWTGGRIYDPENGKTYRAKMHIGSDGRLRLRGYIGISLIGRTAVWTRLEESTASK